MLGSMIAAGAFKPVPAMHEQPFSKRSLLALP